MRKQVWCCSPVCWGRALKWAVGGWRAMGGGTGDTSKPALGVVPGAAGGALG